jgi:hypothetical protein
MFDIKTLAIVDSAKFPVPDASGNPQVDADGNDITITFASPGTPKYLQAKHILDEKTSNGVVARMSGKAGKRSYKEDIADKAEFFANITLSFDNFQYGDKVGFEGYKAFYSDPTLGFIVAGADKYMADWGNFKPGSVTASPSA